MVRLVVGACLNVGIGQVDKSEIKEALDKHRLLSKSWSVPPQGLFLEKICYSFIS
jgi:tRNA pseudouridine38-40 synthase